ncbi:MAG: lysophospholipid acyltransferase family protein [Bacteroidetes bacterium]|nr:lysophospholipid acyltransferase family protein [Bacteroidota bacterium]
MKLRKVRQETLRFTGHLFLTNIVTALCKSLNIIKFNEDSVKELDKKNKKYILVFWHGTMLLPWYLHGNPGFAALISKSKDGNLLAKILKSWKYEVVRGSSSSGGDVALGLMVKYARNDYSITITPDGPRGPYHKFKAGAVVTAKKSEVPLVLAGVGFKKKKILGNWDKFEVPFFFSKAKIVYSEPIYVDSNLSYDETSEMIIDCENKLNELQKQARVF